MSIQRIVLGLCYDGAAYHGWQCQGHIKTIQNTLQQALSDVADHPITVTCAGRTDAGVHATGQVVHFDTQAQRTNDAWLLGTNSHLPSDIRISWVKPVASIVLKPNKTRTNYQTSNVQECDPTFHARFSATARCYRYIIYNHNIPPAILRHAVGWYDPPLDEKKMQEAATHLVGRHDFNAFRGAGCQARTSERTVEYINITRIRRMIVIEIKANAFLLHMVRNMVGSLVWIGSGKRSNDWLKSVLELKERHHAGATMMPNGLYLVNVQYPKTFNLPTRPVGPFFLP